MSAVPVLAVTPFDEVLAKLDLALTPDGDLVVPIDAYKDLTQEQRRLVGDILAYFNNNKQTFSVESGSLQVVDNNMPNEFKPLVAKWQHRKIDVRNSAVHMADKETGILSFPWWYENFYRYSNISHTPVQQLIHTLAVPEHSTAGYNTIGCQSGHTTSRTGTISISGSLSYAEVVLQASVDYTRTIHMDCNSSYQRDIYRAQLCNMYWCYLKYTETQYWDRWYFEDFNEDGITDYAAFVGTQTATLTAYDGGSFDYEIFPYPCQRPCAGLDCPYK